MITKKMKVCILTLLLIFSLTGCKAAQDDNKSTVSNQTSEEVIETNENTVDASSSDENTSEADASNTSDESSSIESTTEETITQENVTDVNTSREDEAINTSFVEGSILDTSEMFSERDLQQAADLADAESIELANNQDVTIDQAGVYVISGKAKEASIIVEADAEAKVQIVLDGVSITNESSPAIYVKAADKVFITSTDNENYLEVTGTYQVDGETNTDAVIFSKSDLTLNGTGTLEIVSTKGNGITSKDELKVTGGTYNITSAADGMEANDSFLIYDGNFNINSNKDAIHSENEEDTTLGIIYIRKGTFHISAADDAIQGNNTIQIDGGIIEIETSAEGIESTYIQINGGEITIYATDDGINATNKSTNDVVIEVNGGSINVSMGSGDTDAFDTNGNIYINNGTINVEANSSFDYDGTAELNGGTVTVNGQVITQITPSRMGGGGGRGMR